MQHSPYRPYDGDRYLHWPEIEAWCDALAEAHPEWVEHRVVGRSREGRPLILLIIGRRQGDRDGRPGFWLDGGTHATEWTGVMATLHTVSRWVGGLADDDTLRAWFESHTVYVMPCISPDGYHSTREGGPAIRSSLRPPPEGTVRIGLDPQDIDGDGAVRWMRWRHPAGPFVADDTVPMFMRPRRLDDDPADAFFFCDEGRLLEWDGHQWISASLEHGVDLNRNFPGHWAPFSMFGMDSGTFPTSEPETRAVVETFAAFPHIAGALTNHTYTGALLVQPYRKPSPLSSEDIELMERLGKQAVEGTDYKVIRVNPDFVYSEDQAVIGVWADTLAVVFGVPGYTLELWDPWRAAGLEVDKPIDFLIKPDPDLMRKAFAHFSSLPGAVHDWRPFDHPQLGPVEIGGIDYMRTIRNPPDDLLPAECERGFTVADRLRRALPRVEASMTLAPEASGLTRVELVLANQGCLPTTGLRHGAQVAGTPPVSARIEAGPGVEIIGEARGVALPHLDGWGTQQGFGAHPIYPSLPSSGHRAVARWWARGAGTVTVRWQAGRGGRGQLSAKV